MKKILVTGSMAYDQLLNYDGVFRDGIDAQATEALSMAFVTSHMTKHHGGTGANIAWMLKLLEQDPYLVATVGHDGASYVTLLDARDICVDGIELLVDHLSSTAIVATDSHSGQVIFYHPGADSHGSWPDLSDKKDEFSYAIVSPRDANMMIQAARWSHAQGVPLIFDPGQQMLALSDDDLRTGIASSMAVIVNEYEWGLLSDRMTCDEQQLLHQVEMLIITRGADGVSVYTREQAYDIPACPIPVVMNPTGAGDAFRAGLLAGLNADWSVTDAARLGCSAASFVVEQDGTLLEKLELGTVFKRAEEAYGEALPKLG